MLEGQVWSAVSRPPAADIVVLLDTCHVREGQVWSAVSTPPVLLDTGHVLEVQVWSAVSNPPVADRLVGLVVKASALRAENPRFESRLRRDFLGVESYQ